LRDAGREVRDTGFGLRDAGREVRVDRSSHHPRTVPRLEAVLAAAPAPSGKVAETLATDAAPDALGPVLRTRSEAERQVEQPVARRHAPLKAAQ